MKNCSNDIIFVAHRFQQRNKVVNAMLDDVTIRLQMPALGAGQLRHFSSTHKPHTMTYFYDYCRFVFQLLCVQQAENSDSAFSILNLVIIYWKEKQRFEGLNNEEVTAIFSAAVSLQDEAQMTPFLSDQLKTLLAEQLHADSQFEAAMHLQKSVAELHAEKLGDGNLASAESALQLAGTYKNSGHIQQALHWYQTAMTGFEANYSSRHEKVKSCLTKLARCQEILGELDGARDSYQRLLAINESELGKSHILTLNCKRHLALCYLEQGDYHHADQMFQQLHKICVTHYGTAHSLSINSVIDLGICRTGMGEYRSAELLFLDVLQAIDSCDDRIESDKVNVYVQLACCYAQQNVYDKMEHYFQRALVLSEERLGSRHEDTYACIKNMAINYHNRGNFNRAEEMYLYALALVEGCHRYHIARVVETRYLLSSFYRDRGNYQLAELVITGALRHLNEKEVCSGPLVSKLDQSYVDCLQQQGKYRSIVLFFTQTLKKSIHLYGVEHPKTQTCLNEFFGSFKWMISQVLSDQNVGEAFCHDVLNDFHQVTATMDKHVAKEVMALCLQLDVKQG